MPIIRFSGLYKSANGTNKDVLSKTTGYSLLRDGDDWIVPEDDPKLKAGPSPVLITENKAILLKPDKYDHIADLYISKYLVNEIEAKFDPKQVKPISVPADFGFTSDLYMNQIEFFFSKRANNQLRNCLVSKVLPFAYNKLNAKYIFPLRIDVSYLQSIISLNKIILLANKYGIEECVKRVIEKRALDSILPSPLDILSYAEVLLTFSPFSVTIPFNRVGSQIHFLGDKNWYFHRIATQGIYEMLLTAPNPLIGDYDFKLVDIASIGSIAARQYYGIVIQSMNNMLCYFADPLNHIISDGVINHQRILQTLCSLNLMVADMSNMNFMNSAYGKSRFALSYLDKLSNLIASYLGIIPRFEADLFKYLLSNGFCNNLVKILKHHIGSVNKHLGKIFCQSTENVFESINNSFIEMKPDLDEAGILEIIRTMRNTAHGSFLKGDKFEVAFMETSLNIPGNIICLPLLITLGLALDTKHFINMISTDLDLYIKHSR